MSSDVLTRVRAEIDARLGELRPVLAEYERLLDAERALVPDAAKVVRAAKATTVTTSDEKKERPQAKRREQPQKEQPLQAASVPSPVRSTRPAATAPARRGRRGSAAGAIKRAASSSRDASQQAIVAALEHGSHTLSELVLVTAIAASELRQGVRQLQQAGTITRMKRDGDGKAAYALSSASTG
jgi:hypothetical protein